MKIPFIALYATLLGFAAHLPAQTTPPPPVGGINGAATVKVEIKNFKAIMQSTPRIPADGVTEKKVPRSRKWLEVEVTFKADKARAEIAKSGPTIDDLEMKYYIMTKAVDPATKQAIMLTGSVSHVNVTTQDETHSVMYASPSALEKLTGKGDFNDSDVQGYAIEVSSGGQTVAEVANPAGAGSKKWWKERTGTDGILVDKTKTPFSILWADYHADVKPK